MLSDIQGSVCWIVAQGADLLSGDVYDAAASIGQQALARECPSKTLVHIL